MSNEKSFKSLENHSVRMFERNWIDFFSRVHFSIPLILYTPIILFLLYQSIFTYQLHVLHLLGLYIGGILFWSFTEYTLHRFVFHYKPTSKWGKRFHFMTHGVHHDYPNDSLRLVMPPAVSLPLSGLFYLLFRWLWGDVALAMTFFTGFATGYLAYDMTHYAIHHLKSKNKLFLALKKHHMVHHFHDSKNGFGVSSVLWDRIFRTTYHLEDKSK